MDNLDEKLKQLEQLRANAQQSSEEINAGLKALKDGIANETHTTGDKLKDFLLVMYGLNPDDKIEQKLRDLQKTIAENSQNQLLVVSRQRSWEGQRGCYGSSWSHIDGGIDLLGIIDGELSFDCKTGDALLPVKKYAKRESHGGKWQLQDGPIKIKAYDLLGLDKWSNHSLNSEDIHWSDYGYRHNSTAENYQFRILTNKEVELFFKLQEEHYLWDGFGAPLLDKIRKGVAKEASADSMQVFGRIDTSYVAALQMIGAEVPENFKKHYAEQITKIKKAVQEIIINNLDELIEGKKGHISNQLSIKTLQDAVELGMHKEPNTIVDYKGIPGLVLDVQKYITALCKEYGVKV